MRIHQFNPHSRPDDEFVAGHLKYLVAGNACRLMDRRRTPGKIEEISIEAGFFRWRILDFEDKGKYWDVPLEDFVNFQFEIGSREETSLAVTCFLKVIEKFQQPLIVRASSVEREETIQRLQKETGEIQAWLNSRIASFLLDPAFDPANGEPHAEIADALEEYMAIREVAEHERLTSETYVLNPFSGEWIKGMEIVLAEMGIKDFKGKTIRCSNLFEAAGDKDLRSRYLCSRLSFLRAIFTLLGKRDVTLFKGMAAEGPWQAGREKFFSSWTFSKTVAESFASFDADDIMTQSYLLKRTLPIGKLFMTSIETRAMSKRYREAEAVVIHDEPDRMLW